MVSRQGVRFTFGTSRKPGALDCGVDFICIKWYFAFFNVIIRIVFLGTMFFYCI